jgi:hypothetical protein
VVSNLSILIWWAFRDVLFVYYLTLCVVIMKSFRARLVSPFIFFRLVCLFYNQITAFTILTFLLELPKIFSLHSGPLLWDHYSPTYLYNLSGNFSSFFRSFLSLLYEHNLIFRISNIAFHGPQILYLGSSCYIIFLRIFPKFLELSE